MKLLKYNTYVVPVTTAKSVILDQLCNGYVIKNAGNTLLIFRNEPIQPGDNKSVGGNYAELCVDRVDISFGAQVTGFPLPPNNSGFVTQKVYLIGEGFDNPLM